MTAAFALRVEVLLLVAAAGGAVVFVRDVVSQTIALSFFGLALALMFFVLQAPDVALSQIVIGAVVLPMMVMLALAKIRRDELRRRTPPDQSEDAQ